jgi:hypothetical protein
MNTIDEKILSKIKKCLALSQSSEPHEAAAAMRQAQKLMELHGVSQADIGRADIGEAEVKSKVSVSRIKDWELKLLNLVAKSFGCKLIWFRSSSYSTDVFGKYILIGLKSQVQLAQYTADVMQRKLIKARGQFVSGFSDRLPRKSKTIEADGFCHGWVKAVSALVHEFALGAETKALIEAEVQSRATGKAPVQRRAAGQMGLNAGFEAGQGESIHRPMGQNTYAKLSHV